VDVWSDVKLKVGDRWKIEIKQALERAAVAILLISADYLASDFVADNELPPLLKAAESAGVTILPIILKPCAFASIDSLSQFQAVNDPKTPIISMNEADREHHWLRISQSARDALAELHCQKPNTVAQIEGPKFQFAKITEMASILLAEEIANPEVIFEYIVYRYEHIDILDFLPLAETILKDVPNSASVIARAREQLTENGWEGDGELRIWWIPPFVGAGAEDTYGAAAWFVKQQNNGTSFIMSPVLLPFSRLLEQNL
jgi:hypothetical protein